MPYKFESEKLHIPEKLDRRCKLTKEQREEIFNLYGTISQRKLAKMYNVSRRLIIFIGNPDKYKENTKRAMKYNKEHYSKERENRYSQSHRAYKKELYKEGKLIKNEI